MIIQTVHCDICHQVIVTKPNSISFLLNGEETETVSCVCDACKDACISALEYRRKHCIEALPNLAKGVPSS